jgi:hypothetical protein
MAIFTQGGGKSFYINEKKAKKKLFVCFNKKCILKVLIN